MLCSRFGSLEICMRKFETACFLSSWNSMKFRQRYLGWGIQHPQSCPAFQPQWGPTSYLFFLFLPASIRTFPLPLNDPASLA